jgi:very-short-patch-repair endonuclease
MRREPTHAEKLLWKELRRLDGFHFHRQVPFGAYIVDFACHRNRLIVEVDGGIHRAPNVALRDAEREAWLKTRGYRVVRVTNFDAIVWIDKAIAAIVAGAQPTPSPPTPPRKGEGSHLRAPDR